MHIYQHAWEPQTARAPAHMKMNAAMHMGTHYMVQKGTKQQPSTEFPTSSGKTYMRTQLAAVETHKCFQWVIFLLILLAQKGFRIFKTIQIPVLKPRKSEITWWCFCFKNTRVPQEKCFPVYKYLGHDQILCKTSLSVKKINYSAY